VNETETICELESTFNAEEGGELAQGKARGGTSAQRTWLSMSKMSRRV